MPEKPLHFIGPLSFMPGHRCLFESPLQNEACVYLWTMRSDLDGRYYIHYVGEAQTFAKRQREHLIHVLGLNYGIFDPADARRGVSTLLWPGLWRMRSGDGPGDAIRQYESLASVVLEYLKTISVFVAPFDGGRELRRRVEGSIAWSLKVNYPEAAALYPPDNRTGSGGGSVGLRLIVTSDEPIAGLDPMLEV